jgi:hypothetical protein
MSATVLQMERDARHSLKTHSRRDFGFRLRVVLPLARYRTRQLLGESPLMLTSTGAELRTLTEVIRYVARVSHVGERSVQRWFARFLRNGVAGLKSKVRKDRGTSKAFDRRGLILAFIWDKEADGCSVRQIRTAIALLWPRLYSDGSRPPSYASLRRFLKQVRP